MTIVLHPDLAFDQITVRDPRGQEVILVNRDGAIHAYRNRCPHIGIGLDYGDGRCLHEGRLVCAMHGALFEPDTGFCFAGPCSGKSLERIAVRVVDGAVVCDAAAEP